MQKKSSEKEQEGKFKVLGQGIQMRTVHVAYCAGPISQVTDGPLLSTVYGAESFKPSIGAVKSITNHDRYVYIYLSTSLYQETARVS